LGERRTLLDGKNIKILLNTYLIISYKLEIQPLVVDLYSRTNLLREKPAYKQEYPADFSTGYFA
jgi:hypothetical protein